MIILRVTGRLRALRRKINVSAEVKVLSSMTKKSILFFPWISKLC